MDERLLEVRRLTVAVQVLTILNLNPLHKDSQNWSYSAGAITANF
jgi:hypothetical protein